MVEHLNPESRKQGVSVQKFGWLGALYQLTGNRFEISTIEDKEKSASDHFGNLLADGWVYRPLDAPRGTTTQLIPSLRIELPVTHQIQLKLSDAGEAVEDFAILVFGWLLGLHLVPEGYGHLNKVAVEQGKLVDFTPYKRDLPKILDDAVDYFMSPEKCKAPSGMHGAIHWYLVSQSQEHIHQQIFGQYMVLDALFHVHKTTLGVPSQVSHAKRINLLAEKYDLVLPPWAETGGGRDSQLSIARNEYFHEAKFGGAPIGHAFPPMWGNLLNEFPAFNSRLIAAMLGAKGPYSRSSTQTRQRFSLDVD